MANSTLEAIRNKVRRITRSLSESQLPTATLDEYINTFVLYDFPEHLRLFNLQKEFSFFTKPFQDVYSTINDNPFDPFYDFKNRYLTINPPAYISGRQMQFFESQDQFFGVYPKINQISSIGVTGDGTTHTFSGVINTQQTAVQPYVNNNSQGTIIVRQTVSFTSRDVNGFALALYDKPVAGFPGIGNLSEYDAAPNPAVAPDPNNFINYLTGQFTITYTSAPAVGAAINSQLLVTQPTIPQSMLFYGGDITFRPVPDQPYEVIIQATLRPTELLTSTQDPDLNEWWQYIAYGACKKVFEDRNDLESVNLIMPEFKKQECLILRRTIVQQTSQRTATIYENGGLGVGGTFGGNGFGGQS